MARKASGPIAGFMKIKVSEEPCKKGSSTRVQGEKSRSQGVSSQQELVPQLLMGGNSHSDRGGWLLPYGFIGLNGGADRKDESRPKKKLRLAKERNEEEQKKKEAERMARNTVTWAADAAQRIKPEISFNLQLESRRCQQILLQK